MPRPPRSTPSPEGLKLYDKWFMQKIPPKGLNLNTPIGAGTEARIRQTVGFAGSRFLQGDVRTPFDFLLTAQALPYGNLCEL